MSEYAEQEIQNACSALGLSYGESYYVSAGYARREGIEIGRFNKEFFIDADRAANIAGAILKAVKDVRRIEARIKLDRERAEELAENNESERDGWFSWPSTTPPDDEECIVTFTENGHARTLIGRYHSEFDLWVFPTLDKRVGTITKSDPAYSDVIYKPLEP